MPDDVSTVLSLFNYEHLPPHLQPMSQKFYELAHDLIANTGTWNRETVKALDKLVEAKDAAVRSVILGNP